MASGLQSSGSGGLKPSGTGGKTGVISKAKSAKSPSFAGGGGGGGSSAGGGGRFSNDSRFETGVTAASAPVISDEDALSMNGRDRAAADAGANLSIQQAANQMGGTDSAAFQLVANSAIGGAKVATAEAANQRLIQAKQINRDALMGGLGLDLNRMQIENAARSIESNAALGNRGMDIESDLGQQRIDQNAIEIAARYRPQTETGGAIWDALDVDRPSPISPFAGGPNYYAGLNR